MDVGSDDCLSARYNVQDSNDFVPTPRKKVLSTFRGKMSRVKGNKHNITELLISP